MAKVTSIELTIKTKEILEKIIRQAKSPQNLVKRAKIILMALTIIITVKYQEDLKLIEE